MNKFLIYVAAAAVGSTIGYFAGKAISRTLPDKFSVKVPFGPTVKATKKVSK